ncbi:MAG: Rid family hydrolase [Rhodospirillales bacterium]|nr:Rid family hydrolase [Rhodospirillales bacterium]
MKKRHAWPPGHWSWPIGIGHKHGLRCGEMVWVGGQVDLDSAGEVRNPGDLAAQTRSAVAYLGAVLDELDADFGDLVKLLCFYVNDGSVDERAFLGQVAGALPGGVRTALTAVPVPYLAYPGLQVEIEGYAMLGRTGEKLARRYAAQSATAGLPASFVPAVRCGEMIFVGAQAPVAADGTILHPGRIVEQTVEVMGRIDSVLRQFGASFDDVVKMNRWYVGQGTVEDFEPAALACAANYSEPGPAATGIPIPRHALDGVQIEIEVIAMLGKDGARLPRKHAWPDSLWDWHVHLPYKHGLKCGEMIFLGGQVSLDKSGQALHPDNLELQTRQAMVHIGTILEELGAGYGDVCKVLTFYQGACGHDDLHRNLAVRSSFFTDPGPATTGIPLPVLAYPHMVVEIDILAMAEES